jgi:hypothetical protein
MFMPVSYLRNRRAQKMGKVSAKKVPTAFLCVIILSTLSLAPAACNNSGTQRAAVHNEWA